MNDSFIDAWHFLREDRRLQYPNAGFDGVVTPGLVLTEDRPLILCKVGLHASRRPLQALEWAPGPVVCRVRLSGEILDGGNKLCASRREVLGLADATTALHLFACDAAERSLQSERMAGREPDPRSWEAARVKRLWIAGGATDQDLSAAWLAAWSAAESAARSALNDLLEARLAALFASPLPTAPIVIAP